MKKKSVGFKTYVDCLHTVLRFFASLPFSHTYVYICDVHIHLMEQLKCGENKHRKNFFKAQKTMFSFSLSLISVF